MKLTFKHGIHPDEKKELTKDCAFENMPTGAKVYIPLSQHIGTPCQTAVEPGDYVKVGSVIGTPVGYVSATVHSSVSGKVLGFELRENAMGRKIRHVVIENDGLYEEELLPKLTNPTKEEIIERCKAAGIVGMGGATFPTHVKLETKTPIDLLIINGSECEPYITTDYRMMLDMPEKVLEGINYIKIALGAKKVAIGIEDNKPDAIENMKRASADSAVTIYPLMTKYPQGGEKQLIYAITRRKVPNGGLPSDVGIIVLNISTAFAIYEAVALGKPCYSRYMTVSGGGIKRPANIFVRNGVPLQEIADYLGDNGNYVKAIFGGPMMGISLPNLNPVVGKGSSALLLLTKDEIRAVEPSPCLNCGRCHNACPIGLMPMLTDAYILKKNIEGARQCFAMSCIECGCCAYVCPAKRPLVQSQRLAKKLIREADAKKNG